MKVGGGLSRRVAPWLLLASMGCQLALGPVEQPERPEVVMREESE